MSANDIPKIQKEPPGTGEYKLTRTQQRRKEKGKSIYKRDRVVKPFTVRKGKFV